MRKAFTLIELIVVITIIVVVASFAAFSLPGFFRSSGYNSTLNTIEMSLIKSQSNAMSYFTTCGIRVERAYETSENEQMIKKNGKPVYKNFQKITFIVFGFEQNNNRINAYSDGIMPPYGYLNEHNSYRKIINEEILYLSENFWVSGTDDLSLNKEWQPLNDNSVSFNLFETFYILFDRFGKLTKKNDWLYYADESQKYDQNNSIVCPLIEKPSLSSVSFFIYDRKKFETTKTFDGKEINISKSGNIIK